MTLVLGIICTVGLLGVGISYAWWRLSFVQDKANTAVSKCLKLELANQSNEINLTNMYPISDEEGRALTPFTFTLKNTCSMSAKYNLNMEMLKGTTLNSGYVAVLVNNKDIRLLSSYDAATTVIDGSTESRTLDTGTLAGNSSKDYSISLWIDEDVTLEDDILNKVFKSKVVVDAVATETAMDKIIASVDTTGKCPTVNDDGSVNVTEVEATDGYLCKAKDAYGDSYYYRGNVTNNYVKFGEWKAQKYFGYYNDTSSSYWVYDSLKECQDASEYNVNCRIGIDVGMPMYWRILRINGDGTVRAIYDGTSAHANGESSKDRQIGMSKFNSSYYDNAYVGYMYGQTGASTYADAHANTNNSTIKIYIDNWYKANIVGTTNEQYLADNAFCNDRSISSNKPNINGISYNNLGFGTDGTAYRWYYAPWDSGGYNSSMRLICPQKNDAFTVSDTTNGNGALTYPVGLLSTDEIVLAGGWNAENSGYYLYSGEPWWTSSSSVWHNRNSGYALVRYVASDGDADGYGFFVNGVGDNWWVRPVINLKAEVLAQGSGTAEDPYHLSS